MLTLCAGLLIGSCAVIVSREHWHIPLGPGVAVLDVYGELLDERPILEELRDLTDNPDTKALVVRVDSPGGAIGVVEEIFRGIRRAAEKKNLPVVASMGTTAASGGYYVCLAAQRIYANETTLTGSIGVLVETTTAAGLLEKLGVRIETIKSGEFKAAGSLSEPLTERQRAQMQDVINDFHAHFVERVAQARRLDMAAAGALADGRVFTGRQAKTAGLVDEIGGLDDAVAHAARLAGLEDTPRLIRIEPPAFQLPAWMGEGAETLLARYRSAPKYLLRQ